MYRLYDLYRTNHGTSFLKARCVAPALLAALLGCSTVASAQTPPVPASAKTTVPDAQVEASVLKGLAGASDLANQPITTTTVYGVVTLSGSVQTEAMRTEAETIVSRTSGVQKVIDEMTLGGDGAIPQPADAQGAAPVLQSDGTMAPPPGQAQSSPDSDNTQAPNQAPTQASGPGYGPGAPEYRRPYYPGGYGPPPNYGAAPSNGAANNAAPQQG